MVLEVMRGMQEQDMILVSGFCTLRLQKQNNRSEEIGFSFSPLARLSNGLYVSLAAISFFWLETNYLRIYRTDFHDFLERSEKECQILRVQSYSYYHDSRCSRSLVSKEYKRGLAVASIARDDPSTLPGDDPFLRARMHRDRNAR